MKPSKLRIILLGLCLSLASLAASTPGQPRPHCFAVLSPVDSETNEPSNIVQSGCFVTFSEAVEAASQGQLRLDPSMHPNRFAAEIEKYNAVTPLAQVVIGIDWDQANYGGVSFTWAVTGGGCSDTISYRAPSMPANWDDRVSSARGYSSCNYYYHYRDANYGGGAVVCSPNCATMGSLDKATSSEEWRKNPK